MGNVAKSDRGVKTARGVLHKHTVHFIQQRALAAHGSAADEVQCIYAANNTVGWGASQKSRAQAPQSAAWERRATDSLEKQPACTRTRTQRVLLAAWKQQPRMHALRDKVVAPSRSRERKTDRDSTVYVRSTAVVEGLTEDLRFLVRAPQDGLQLVHTDAKCQVFLLVRTEDPVNVLLVHCAPKENQTHTHRSFITQTQVSHAQTPTQLGAQCNSYSSSRHRIIRSKGRA